MDAARTQTLLLVLEASSYTPSGIDGFEARNNLISNLEDRLFSPEDDNVVDTLPRIILRALEQTEDSVTACPICFADYFEGKMAVQVVELPCKHCFCEACARKWLLKQQTCPLCRQAVAHSAEVSSLRSESQEIDSIWEARHQQRRRDWNSGTSEADSRIGEVDSEGTLMAEAIAGARQRRRRAGAQGAQQPHQALATRSSRARIRRTNSGSVSLVGRGSSRAKMQEMHDLRRSTNSRAAAHASNSRAGLRARAGERLADLQQTMQHANGRTGTALRRYEARNARQNTALGNGPNLRYFGSA
jgi:hypothetical protein